MTTSKTDERARRSGFRRSTGLAGWLAQELRKRHPDPNVLRWPSPKWRDDPRGFFLEVLGVEPWDRQVEVIEAVRDHPRVAVRSGHKVSKSHSAAGIALWYYSSFDDARVVMSSTTSRQVDRILWREFRMMHARAKQPIGGEPGQLARTGLTAPDFREVVGFTAREAEAVAGVSGKNLLYLLDEASGIPDVIFEAIEGNRAGGARSVMFSNPTRTEGEFYRAFTEKREFYHKIWISSEESPNVVEGREVIPGLATRAWVEEKKREWGEESPLYKIRVKGDFVLNEEGKILSVAAITQAEQAWEDADDNGRLFLGLDPAGPGEGGDETAAAVRRSQKVLRIAGWHGLTADGIVTNVLGLLMEFRDRRETAVVVVDKLGPIGVEVHAKLVLAAEAHPGTFEVFGVRASDKAIREPLTYDRVRDELWANFARWIREGGGIPEDTRLAKELHAPDWIGTLSGRLKATSKDELKKKLGHSTDRADAVCLSVWEPMATLPGHDERRDEVEPHEDAPGEIDPYAAEVDPYE